MNADSEKLFKTEVRLRRQLRQQLFAFKMFCMEMRLLNIFKTTEVTKSSKAILESHDRVL